ncbi:MAG TPA: glycosyltransferase, partial [Chryseosolibacter sp.]
IALTRYGNTVYFLNPPSRSSTCSRTAYTGLYTIDYTPVVRGLNRMPEGIARRLSCLDVKKISALAKTSFDVIWSFDPFRLQFPRLFRAPTNIYFAADWHAARKKEILIANQSDVVLSPSRLLLDSIDTKTLKYFIHHAVADYFFDAKAMQQLPGHNPFKVGYVGNLHSKYLDFRLLKRVIAENADCDFIFVGDDSGTPLKDTRPAENVFFLGAFSSDRVPAFLKACDILLLCYDTVSYRAQASNSHKVMEYLASGKAIVSTRMEEYLHAPRLLNMPENNGELPALLRSVKEKLHVLNNPQSQETRIEFARTNTYDYQLSTIDRVIDEAKSGNPSFAA